MKRNSAMTASENYGYWEGRAEQKEKDEAEISNLQEARYTDEEIREAVNDTVKTMHLGRGGVARNVMARLRWMRRQEVTG